MTEQVQGSPDVSLASHEMVSTQPSEKTLTQDQVNHLVGRIKAETEAKAYMKGKNDAAAELQKQPGIQSSLNSDDISRMVEDATQKALEGHRKQYEEQVYIAHANQIVGEFKSKIDAAKSEHPDIEETLAPLQLDRIPEILPLVNQTDNTADVMVDLAKNPHKLASILSLAQRAPHLAQLEVQRLSSSIKTNKAAVHTKTPNEPLSQINPSIVTPDSGEKDIAYFKRQAYLKG